MSTRPVRKHKITARKSGGNDSHSWAVFIDGRVYANGLSHREVPHYKELALKSISPTTATGV